jgi:hypothetical protein
LQKKGAHPGAFFAAVAVKSSEASIGLFSARKQPDNTKLNPFDVAWKSRDFIRLLFRTDALN